MGRKGRWFSAIRRAFTAGSKEEAPDPPRGRRVMKKRWGFGMSKPSSIEKILEDAESEWRRQRVQTTIELDRARVSAIKIQAAYRGYRARRRYKALRGMMRLQRVVRGQEVKRQMANTMRHMQRLVRVQSQVQAWRSRMAERRRLQLLRHAERNFPRQEEAVGGHGGWDDSLLAKDQVEARMRRKVEAAAKRERALAYAYSHHLLEATHESTEAMLTGPAPWWWTRLERQQPPSEPPAAGHSRLKPAEADVASLTSCPPFAAPNYMAPTASAKAKARAAPSPQQEPRKKRFSFGLSQSISSLFAGKEAAAAAGTERSGGRQRRHRPTRSAGSVSVDSAMSLPVGAVACREEGLHQLWQAKRSPQRPERRGFIK